MSTARLNFRVSPEVKAQLEHIAWQRKLPASELLRRIAEDYLKKEEKQEVKKAAPVAQQ